VSGRTKKSCAPRAGGLPATAAWRHLDARDGFEVLFARVEGERCRVEGHATAVEDEHVWSIRFAIELDAGWATRSALVVSRSQLGTREVRLEADGRGGWQVDGLAAAHLDGCLDVDLEASAFTNAFPVRRLGLEVGEAAEAPAAYVRAPGLAVERLEQRYERLDGPAGRARYAYESPAFGFAATLVFDEHGLVLDYPGIAVRVV
jgi:hypothetical protein